MHGALNFEVLPAAFAVAATKTLFEPGPVTKPSGNQPSAISAVSFTVASLPVPK
jgi:hypothetical protein